MSDVMKSGFGLLAFAAVLIGLIAFNFYTGDAHLIGGKFADRRDDPFGIWFVQIFIGFFVAMSIFMVVQVFTGRVAD